jgi:tellurite resistance protein
MNHDELKTKILADGSIDAGEAAQLRELIMADGQVDEDEKQLLRDLKAGAKSISAEFDQLCGECGI